MSALLCEAFIADRRNYRGAATLAAPLAGIDEDARARRALP